MFGDMSGPTLLLLIGPVTLIAIGAIVGLVLWSVRRSSRNKQAELQRAYEAGLQQGHNQPPTT